MLTSAALVGPALAVAAAAVGLLLVAPRLGRPLVYDDANFAFAARAVAETGLPFGNMGWLGEWQAPLHREQWALWHPPLYVFLLGLVARLAGPGEVALRLPALLGGLATLALTYRLAAELTEAAPHERRLAGGIAAALALLSPLALQSTLVLDIDFSLLLPLSLLFLLLYLRLEATERRWQLLIPLFALLLWVKMTTPLALLAAVAAWQLARGQLRRALAHTVDIGVGGGLLFAASWVGVGTLLGFPLGMPFLVNYGQLRDAAQLAGPAFAGAAGFAAALAPAVLWLGPALVALGLLAGAVRGAQLAGRWQPRGIDLVLGLVVLLGLAYAGKSSAWFPKYQVVLAPLLAAAGAPLAARALVRQPRRAAAAVAVAAALGGALLAAGVVRDDWALTRSWAPDRDGVVGLLAVGGAAAAVGLWLRSPAVAALALAGLALGWSVGMGLVQRGAPYSTTYWYGAAGTAEAAAWVDRHVPPAATYVAAKEVAVHARSQRYVDQENLVRRLHWGLPFDGSWSGEPVVAVVALVRDPIAADVVARTLPAHGFAEAERLGDYAVYLPAGGASGPHRDPAR